MTGAELIAAERKRQIKEEGWTPEHDAQHAEGELVGAALAYLSIVHTPGEFGEQAADEAWPWAAKWWKRSEDPVRNLVKAGAFIAAEIDRLTDPEAEYAKDAALPAGNYVATENGYHRLTDPEEATQEEATKLRCPMNTGACPVRQRTSALEEVAQASLELRRSWAASSRRGTGVGWERWLNALATLERLTDPEAAP